MTKSPFAIGATVLFTEIYQDEYNNCHAVDRVGTVTSHRNRNGHIISFTSGITGIAQEVYCLTEDLRLQIPEELLDQLVEL